MLGEFSSMLLSKLLPLVVLHGVLLGVPRMILGDILGVVTSDLDRRRVLGPYATTFLLRWSFGLVRLGIGDNGGLELGVMDGCCGVTSSPTVSPPLPSSLTLSSSLLSSPLPSLNVFRNMSNKFVPSLVAVELVA